MKKYLNSRGFNFLEVLAALVILSVALVPILTWVPASIQTKLKSERKTISVFLCQSKMEELRYQIIRNFNNDYNANGQAFNSPYQDYRYTITDNLGTNIKIISVSVWHVETPQHETIFYTQAASR
ncbi:MAG: type II secretion system protein [Candidatus Omnitrophota bacterium]